MAPRGMPRLIITATKPIIVPSIFCSFVIFEAPRAPRLAGTAVNRRYVEGARKVPWGQAKGRSDLAGSPGRDSDWRSMLHRYKGELLDFADLHGLVHLVRGIADGRTGGRGRVASGDGEVVAGAIDGVGVAIALGPRQAHGAGSEEFIHGHAMTVDADAVALRFGNLQKVHFHTSEVDGLRGRGALGDGGDALDVEHVNTEEKSDGYEEAGQKLHKEIVRLSDARCNINASVRAEGNNSAVFASRRRALC